MSIYFGDHTWPELEEIIKKDPVVLLPVGMFEEHGRHMAVSTDTDIVQYMCDEVARRIQNDIPVLVLPAVWTGFHGNCVNKFPGGVRMKQETLIQVVFDIIKSLADMGIKKIVVANGHGQNPASLEVAIRKAIDECQVVPVLCMPGNMGSKAPQPGRTSPQGAMGGHACEWETSLLMAINPDHVHMECAEDDSQKYHSQFIGGDMYPTQKMAAGRIYWSTFNIQPTHHGAQGNPQHASMETGVYFRDNALDTFEALVREYYAFNDYVF